MPEEASGSVAGEQLAQFVSRIERLEEEKAGISGDIKDIYTELAGVGFDKKVVRAIVRRRKLDRAERQEQDSLLNVYEASLGME